MNLETNIDEPSESMHLNISSFVKFYYQVNGL